jgi:hypothetical protein
MVGQPPQRGFHQRRRALEPLVVLALAQQQREQVPDLLRRGAQPVPLVVIAQQHLRDRQADQLGVGHLRRLARAAAAKTQGGDAAVGQLHVECDQESAQVGDHDEFPWSDVQMRRSWTLFAYPSPITCGMSRHIVRGVG